MSAGLKNKKPGILFFLLTLLNKKNGFSLVELLVVTFIFSLIMGGVMLTLNTGQFSSSISAAKADLQADVRRVLDEIIRDVRQTITWEIANNSPSSIHIKFRQVSGWDSVAHALQLSSNYIEYEYNAASSILTRRLLDGSGTVLQTRQYDRIIAEPFRNRDLSSLIENELRNNKRLTIVISSQVTVNSSLILNKTLKEELKIRNE